MTAAAGQQPASSVTESFPFAFDPPLDTWARRCAVVPTRSYVRVDDHGFEAVFGPWRVASLWTNVAAVERTGPYRGWKVAGPAHVSFADRGITMAATTRGGICLRFRHAVPGIDPFGLVRHPAATLGVDDLDRFEQLASERVARSGHTVPGSAPPDHLEGGGLAAARALWNWRCRDVAHDERDVGRIDPPPHDRPGGNDDQPIEVAVGPTFRRRYRIVVRGATLGATEAMALVRADPNVLADTRLAPFTKVRGASGAMQAGDRYVIEIAGPWKGAVEVVDVRPDAFRLGTLEGHMESGVIEMRARDEGSTVTFEIESWARSHDRFLDALYDKLGIAKALQGEMWAIACDRFAALVGGTPADRIDVVTERAR